MGYLAVLATAIVERRRELEHLAEESNRPAADEIAVFVRRLLAHLVRSDGSIGMEELMILCGFSPEDYSWRQEIELAQTMADRSPDFAKQVPDFLLAAREHDRAQGSAIAPAMRRSISALCETVVTADEYTHPRERDFIDRLMTTLSS